MRPAPPDVGGPHLESSEHSPRLIRLLALTAGVVIASNYYVQSLAPHMAASLGLQRNHSGILVTLSQAGYVVGLLAFVPLGDQIDRRRLCLRLMTLTAGGLMLAALARSALWLEACLFAFGATTVVTQIAITVAADVAAPARRGRDVGTVATGALVGVLLSRTAAGGMAELVGWRGVYASAAVLVLIMALLLRTRLPTLLPTTGYGYMRSLRATAKLFGEHAALRRACLYGSLTFAAFSAMWATLASMLSGAPHYLSEGAIGLFGLAAAGGAAGASIGGRLFDGGHARVVTPVGLALGLVAFVLLAVGRSSIAVLVVGIVAVDLAGQLVQIVNQATIYALGDARSRLTAAYMTSRFVGGAAGSAMGTLIYAARGWTASCLAAGGLYAAGLLLVFALPLRRRRGA